ncbi:PD-(D/E)XK nuclease family protein [Virgibacillus halodenitrificans]|uniref:PDDEXK-like family protein n=1 Tax=Virgibacillus halodenitrificans TaxID=1482 RepID=UPI0002ECAE7C|nr:PD-(D/E)XK nuclease family protein [Virgibacillus halodenitrificans]
MKHDKELNNRQALEKFLMDVEILDKIESKLSNFNVFETMGMINTEIRHSNVLSWLLTPRENHELGDYIIKNLVQKVVYQTSNDIPGINYNPLEVSLLDYHDFSARREWKNIDVLTVSEANKFVIVIENKVWSSESEHQLKKYYDIIQEEFRDYHKLLIFLTPFGDEASNPQNWVSFDYNSLINIVEKGLSFKGDSLKNSVRLFLEQYIATVRRYIVGDNELEEICRRIYYKHKKALDLIYEYKPDIYSDIANDLEKLIEETPSLILDGSNKSYIRFTTEKLDKIFEKKGYGWTATKRLLLFEFQNKNNKVELKLIIGPGDNDQRKSIYEIAENNQGVFKPRKYSPQYTQIYTKEFLPNHFDENPDYERIYKQIEKKFEKFIYQDLVKIQEVFEQE